MNQKATIFDFARMCESNESNCECCPLSRHNNGTGIGCGGLLHRHTDKANEIILKWCKEHPIKTRQDKFLNMFPNAKVTSDCLDICPQDIDKTYTCKFNPDTCDKCKRKYWLAEVKE